MKTLFALSLALCLFVTPAAAETPSVDFDFAHAGTLLPEGVDPAEVLTIATEREGDALRGVILLRDGRSFSFDAQQRSPR